MVPLAGSFLRDKVGDSKGTGRNRRSTVGDCGADLGVQTGTGGESDFLMSIESSDRLHSDQIPVKMTNECGKFISKPPA